MKQGRFCLRCDEPVGRTLYLRSVCVRCEEIERGHDELRALEPAPAAVQTPTRFGRVLSLRRERDAA